MSYIAKVSSKGWVVIPKPLRDRYRILPGSKLLFAERDDKLTIIPLPQDPVRSFRGMLKDYSLVQELLKSRKEEETIEEVRAGQLRGTGLLSE